MSAISLANFPNKLPKEVVEMILKHLTYKELKLATLVSTIWNQMVSNSKVFLDSTSREFRIEERSALRCAMKFKRHYRTLSIGQKDWWSSEKLNISHTNALNQFSEHLTIINIDKVRIKKGELKNFLQFLAACSSLEEMHLTHLRSDFKYQVGKFLAKLSPTVRVIKSTSSDWILGHLECAELDTLEIVRKYQAPFNEGLKPKDKICYFLNSLKKLRSLIIENVDMNSEEIELKPSFAWKCLKYEDKSAPDFDNRVTNCLVNWKNLMEISNGDAELIVNVKTLSKPLVQLLNIVTDYSSVTKLTIRSAFNAPTLRLRDFDNFKGLKNNSNVKYLRVGLVFDRDPSESMENLLDRFKNLRCVDFERDLFRLIRGEKAEELLKNVQVLRITTMSARIANVCLPNLKTFVLRKLFKQDLQYLKNFVARNPKISAIRIQKSSALKTDKSSKPSNDQKFEIVVTGEMLMEQIESYYNK